MSGLARRQEEAIHLSIGIKTMKSFSFLVVSVWIVDNDGIAWVKFRCFINFSSRRLFQAISFYLKRKEKEDFGYRSLKGVAKRKGKYSNVDRRCGLCWIRSILFCWEDSLPFFLQKIFVRSRSTERIFWPVTYQPRSCHWLSVTTLLLVESLSMDGCLVVWKRTIQRC